MTLRILSGNGALQIMPFRKLGGKCHFFLRFCTRKRSETYYLCNTANECYYWKFFGFVWKMGCLLKVEIIVQIHVYKSVISLFRTVRRRQCIQKHLSVHRRRVWCHFLSGTMLLPGVSPFKGVSIQGVSPSRGSPSRGFSIQRVCVMKF